MTKVLFNRNNAVSAFSLICIILGFTSCINENTKKENTSVCFELDANNTNYDNLQEFNEKLVGKETYENYLAIVKDSMKTWNILDISDTSKYRYWGYNPILKFNAKKTCFYIDVYYAYKIHPDTIKKYDEEWKAYDEQIARGEYSTENYMGSEIIVDPKSPRYLTEYDFENFLIKIRDGKLYLMARISNSGITLGHNTGEKFLLESLQKSQSHYYLVKRGNKYCLSEYYLKLDETKFE